MSLTWKKCKYGNNNVLGNDGCYGNGLYVVVGSGGAIYTSIDGVIWNRQIIENSPKLSSCCYGNNQFVVTGQASDSTTGVILTSSDGINWVEQNSGVNRNISNIVYGNNKYVCSAYLDILVSEDGINWEKVESVTDTIISSIIFANNQFILVGGNCQIGTSIDGINWEISKSVFNNDFISDICYGNGLYVVCTRTAEIYTSINLTNWNLVNQLTIRSGDFKASYGNGIYVVSGMQSQNTTYKTVILTSTNGTNWEQSGISESSAVKSISYGSNIFMLIDNYLYIANTKEVKAIDWKTNGNNNYTKCSIINGEYYTCAFDGSESIIYKINKNNVLETHPTGNSNILYKVAYANNIYVAVGFNGTILTSTDLVTWTKRTSGTTNVLFNIKVINNKFIIVGTNLILTSTDGINWTKITNTINGQNIYYKNGLYIIVGSIRVNTNDDFETNAISISNDLYNWDNKILDGFGQLSGICYGNGKFIVTGFTYDNGSLVYRSLDGINWEKTANGFVTNMYEVCYDHYQFIAVGSSQNNAKIFASINGADWEEIYTINQSSSLNSIDYNNKQYLCSGMNLMLSATKTQDDSGIYVAMNNEYKYCELYTSKNGEYKKCETYISNDNEYKKCGI